MSECKFRAADGECLREKEFPYKEFCVDGPCPHYTAQTNADRIRAMTDEELAEFVAQQRFCTINPIADRLGIDTTKMFIECRDIMLDWLKQEAI